MRIGTRRSEASANTGSSRWSFSRKPCARGCSLIPRRSGVERAHRLLHRARGQVEADEGDEEPVGAGRRLQRAVVRGAEGRLAVRLVQAEREGPLDAPAPEEGGEVLVGRDHPVDVAADVDVRVEQGRPGRDEASCLLLVPLHQAARPLEDLVHGGESTGSGYHREPCRTSSSLATPSAPPSCATRCRCRSPTPSCTWSATARARRTWARSSFRACARSTASRRCRSRSSGSTSWSSGA